MRDDGKSTIGLGQVLFAHLMYEKHFFQIIKQFFKKMFLFLKISFLGGKIAKIARTRFFIRGTIGDDFAKMRKIQIRNGKGR